MFLPSDDSDLEYLLQIPIVDTGNRKPFIYSPIIRYEENLEMEKGIKQERSREKEIHVAYWAIPAEYAGKYECLMN